MATSNNTVVVSRIQNRRGLKQDLPQPLRSGEIGLATDSRQVFIGGDEKNSTLNKTVIYETTDNARQVVDSIAKNQIIEFNVPHRRYNTSLDGLDGTAKSFTYTGSSDVSITNSSRDVFRSTVGAGDVVSIESGAAFDADDLTVVKNGTILLGNNTASAGNLTTEDYIFSSGTSLGNDHTITFKTIPLTSDDIGITYYGNSAVIRALDGASNSDANIKPGYTTLTNFYSRQNIPTFLQIPTDLIVVNATTGTGYIGLQHKHTAVISTSTADITTLGFTNLLVSRSSDKVTGITFAESSDTFTIPYTNADQKYTALANNYNRVYIQDSTVAAVNGVHNITAANATHFQFAINGYSGATSGTISHTRVLQFDLSGAPSSGNVTTALNTVTGIVNNRGNIITQGSAGNVTTASWPSLQLLPQFNPATGNQLSSSQVYFTHQSAQSSTPANFTLHESGSTLTNLKLTPKEYKRSTDTVKAQLEEFLVDAMIDSELSLFESIKTNQAYTDDNNTATELDPYVLNTNTEGTEITFNSNEEARNFSTLVNKLYFEYSIYNTPGAGGLGSLSVSSRGLTNVKNNIQLQTAEGAASGLPDVGYDSTETASVPQQANTAIKTFDMTTYDTFVIDYSIDFRNGVNLYRKVGLLQLSSYDYGSGQPADVVIQDYGTDKAVGTVAGNVQFTANVSSSVLTLTAISSVNQSCNMKYIVRKWNAPLT
tara:strand:- start:3708 stop:5843 length:2136 start_codon:yes stop_codon:yes gene_type:complete